MVTEEQREKLLEKGDQEYNAAITAIEDDDFEGAYHHFEKAEAAFSELQDQHWLTFLFHEKLRIFLQLDELEQALLLVEKIIQGYLETKNKRGLALIHIHQAEILRKMDKSDEALAPLRTAEAIVTSEKIENLEGYLHSSLSIAHMEIGEFTAAIQSLETAMKIYAEENSHDEYAWCQHQLGLCYKQLIDFNNAERLLTGAYQNYFKIGLDREGREVIESLKDLFISSNQMSKLVSLESKTKSKRF